MKKAYYIVFFPLFFILFCHADAYAADNLRSEAIAKLQRAVARAMPEETEIVRVAVLDIEGDDGALKEAIISAITEDTSFRVIEREDLDRILEEQGLQLEDIIDERTRIEPGRIKGVQGLLMGRVLETEEGFLSHNIRVFLKLDNVEKGEIVFAEEFAGTAVSPVKDLIIFAAFAIVAVVFISLGVARRQANVKGSRIQRDVQVRADITREIGKARASVSELKARLIDGGNTDGAILFKEVERDLEMLRDQVESAMSGNAETRSSREFKRTLRSDEKFVATAGNLTRLTDRLHNMAASGETDRLAQEVDILKKDLRNALNEWHGRAV